MIRANYTNACCAMNIGPKHKMPAFTIRPEQANDYEVIYDITKRAFAPMPFSEGDEQDLINRLRDNDALEISLVAQIGSDIVGHIAFSKAFPENETAKDEADFYTLGPIAVEPKLQRSGIGSALIYAGINMLREREAKCCILIGNTDYYQRFGFETAPHLCPKGEPADHYMILPLALKNIDSIIGFHPLFHSEE